MGNREFAARHDWEAWDERDAVTVCEGHTISEAPVDFEDFTDADDRINRALDAGDYDLADAMLECQGYAISDELDRLQYS